MFTHRVRTVIETYEKAMSINTLSKEVLPQYSRPARFRLGVGPWLARGSCIQFAVLEGSCVAMCGDVFCCGVVCWVVVLQLNTAAQKLVCMRGAVKERPTSRTAYKPVPPGETWSRSRS